jgi:signal transduction histidine kinase
MVRNVIQNATKFTPKNGRINVTFEERGAFLHTIVRDDGIGISKLNLSKIYAGDDWVSTKGTENELGSGFGLKTCIYYANLNGGSVDIESVEGKGTIVEIKTLMK